MTEFADILAIPLSDVFNKITKILSWPADWKVEIVTVIPKCAKPEPFEELRNIS